MTRRALRVVVLVGVGCIVVGLVIAMVSGLPAQGPTGPARYTDAVDDGSSRALGLLMLTGGLMLATGLLGFLLGTRRRPPG